MTPLASALASARSAPVRAAGRAATLAAGLALVACSARAEPRATLAGVRAAPADSTPPRLSDVRQVTGALGFRSPTFSLKGDELAFVRATFPGGLHRMGVREPVPVLAIPGIGANEPWRFGAEGMALDTAPEVWGERWWLSVDASGHTVMRAGEDQPVWRGVRIRDHQLEVFARGEFARWDLPRDHWREPAVSDDSRWIAVTGEEAGLVLIDTWNKALRYLGPAGRGSFSPGGRWLVFDRVPDGPSAPGGSTEAADLVAYEIAADRTTPLTTTADRAERRPEVSPDGKRLAFDAGGAIYLATFEAPRRASDPRPGDVPVPAVPSVPTPPSRPRPLPPRPLAPPAPPVGR